MRDSDLVTKIRERCTVKEKQSGGTKREIRWRKL